jgi:hypothetical protein
MLWHLAEFAERLWPTLIWKAWITVKPETISIVAASLGQPRVERRPVAQFRSRAFSGPLGFAQLRLRHSNVAQGRESMPAQIGCLRRGITDVVAKNADEVRQHWNSSGDFTDVAVRFIDAEIEGTGVVGSFAAQLCTF